MNQYGIVPIIPVEESVKANEDKLRPHFEEIGRLLFTESLEVIDMDIPPDAKQERLQSIADRLAEIVYPATACSRGCNHCCSMAVGITEYEATRIAKFLGIEARTLPKMTLAMAAVARETIVEKYMNVQCPFMKKRECSIYEVRPLACRTHFNISAFPQLCDTINNPGSEVPNLNFTPLWAASATVSLNGSFGDIREYFPDGARTEIQL